MPSPSLPPSPEAIDAAWLEGALCQRQPGTRVAGVEPRTIINGAGTKLCIAVDYAANPHALPTTLWIKSGWETHSAMMMESGNYVREAVFFDRLAVAGVRAPRAFHADWADDGQSIVVMEDLHERGAELWECTVARPVPDVEAMLETLACLHAKWWESPELHTMEHIDITLRADGPGAAWARMNGADRLRDVLSGPRGNGVPEQVKSPERIEAAFWRMIASLESAPGGCLIHGDPHPGNCFSDADGGGGLYDWQTIARGPWAFDVAYHIITSLSPDDRRRSERHLLASYRTALGRHGVASVPGEAEAWEQYRRHLAYSLLIWPTNHTTHQSEENIRALTLRVGVAAADLDFFSAWQV